MYITRSCEGTIRRLSRTFKVVYVGGPRQVGKTTVLRHLVRRGERRILSLDDPAIRRLAQTDPELLLDRFPPPLLIDEVQYAPEIFPAIKRRVDASDARGRYWLTGSQQFSVLQGLRESLAGRVGILHLLGFSLAEILRKPVSKGPFPFPKTGTGLMPLSERSLFEHIWRGSFPALWVSHSPDWSAFYSAYVQTYLERDVSLIAGVTKLGAFQDFIALCAARTGQLLHVSELARDAGISVHAARAWLSILEQSLIVFRLRPYHANLTKRMVKMSKLYMLDTGLASFLCRWQTPGTLMAGAMSGPLFETFVVGEIIKSYFLRGLPPPITFFRDKEGHEVDLLIEADGALHPFEIKRAVQVRPDALAQIAFLRSRIPRIGRGGVISLVPEVVPLSREDDVIPVGAIS